jgi:hypothetical protein
MYPNVMAQAPIRAHAFQKVSAMQVYSKFETADRFGG